MAEQKDTKEVQKQGNAEKGSSGKLAVILIRGAIRAGRGVKDTLNSLKLRQKNACVVVDDSPSSRAMLKKVKDFVTYGEVSDDVLKVLQEKRGRKDKDGKLSNLFLLHPPRGGFERKGIKRSFYLGGALGYRREKIDDLLRRML